jgi:hypothetical protein
MSKAKKLLEYLSTAYHHNVGDNVSPMIKEQSKDKKPASMEQAKSRWKSYTKSVLSNDAKKAFKYGENWSTINEFPVVYSSDKVFILYFTKDDTGNITVWQGVPSGVTKEQAKELLK